MICKFFQFPSFNFSINKLKIDKSQVKSLSERLIMVNKNDRVIGSITKIKGHLKSENNENPHRAFSVFLFNQKNELLIQQRSQKKVTFPLLWSNTVCSHPLSIPSEILEKNNEGILNAVVRRVKFELGLNTQKSKYLLFNRILYKADSDTRFEEFELDYLFLIKETGKNGKLRYVNRKKNSDEVNAIDFISYRNLVEDMKRNEEKYTPWFKYIIKRKGKEMFDIVSENKMKSYKYNNEIISFL